MPLCNLHKAGSYQKNRRPEPLPGSPEARQPGGGGPLKEPGHSGGGSPPSKIKTKNPPEGEGKEEREKVPKNPKRERKNI